MISDNVIELESLGTINDVNIDTIYQSSVEIFTRLGSVLVSPGALEQLVSLKLLTYVAYFVLATCFLVFVQNKLFYLRCVFEIKVFTK